MERPMGDLSRSRELRRPLPQYAEVRFEWYSIARELTIFYEAHFM
jgi:hypothetical protein